LKKRRVAHYFTLNASVNEGRVVGRANNAQAPLVGLYEILCGELFSTIDDRLRSTVNVIIVRKNLRLCMPKAKVSDVLADIGRLINEAANCDSG